MQSYEQVGINRWWRVAGGLSMNLALGTLYGWSVFVAPLEERFGWKRAETSMVFTIAVIVFALSFVIAGRIQDKFGPVGYSLRRHPGHIGILPLLVRNQPHLALRVFRRNRRPRQRFRIRHTNSRNGQ